MNKMHYVTTGLAAVIAATAINANAQVGLGTAPRVVAPPVAAPAAPAAELATSFAEFGLPPSAVSSSMGRAMEMMGKDYPEVQKYVQMMADGIHSEKNEKLKAKKKQLAASTVGALTHVMDPKGTGTITNEQIAKNTATIKLAYLAARAAQLSTPTAEAAATTLEVMAEDVANAAPGQAEAVLNRDAVNRHAEGVASWEDFTVKGTTCLGM